MKLDAMVEDGSGAFAQVSVRALAVLPVVPILALVVALAACSGDGGATAGLRSARLDGVVRSDGSVDMELDAEFATAASGTLPLPKPLLGATTDIELDGRPTSRSGMPSSATIRSASSWAYSDRPPATDQGRIDGL